METKAQIMAKKRRRRRGMALFLAAMVLLLACSCWRALLPPPQPRSSTPRVRIQQLVYHHKDDDQLKLHQIKHFEKEELDMGRNGTGVCRKNRLDTTAHVVTSDGDEAGVQVKNILKAKPMASYFTSSATTPPQGKPEFLPFNNDGSSGAFRNREYPVGDGKALQFAYIVMPGSMESSHASKSSHIARILPLIIGQNVTCAVLSQADDYFEFIPLEYSRRTAYIAYSESELIGLTVALTTVAAMVTAVYINGLGSRCLGKKAYAVALVLLALKPVQSVPAADPEIVAVDLEDSYTAFFDLMHNALEANTEEVDGHYILPAEMDMNDAQKPTRWISVQVTGDAVGRTALMYFRADNIYLVGFMNSVGTLFCTDDAVDMFPLEGCTPLGFTSNYHDLTERPKKFLDLGLFMQDALLGREGALEAANVLAMYQVEIFDQSAVKNAMLAYSIMIAEAMRFKPIGDLVKANWEHSTVLPKELCNLPFVWQDVSILWCRHDKITVDTPKWSRGIDRLKKANIRNEQDVDRVLDLAKGEKQCLRLRREKKPQP